MYCKHPFFKEINDEEKIWRFLDLAKFCDILEKNSLFFVKPKKFSDPWEGYFTNKNFEEAYYNELPNDIRTQLIKHDKKIRPERVREDCAVSCWHVNEYESEAFWRIYSGRGIAIQSTYKKLRDSFLNNKDYSIYIGKVEYKDHQTDKVDPRNIFPSILWKRKSFSHENELRAVIWRMENINGTGIKEFNNPNGQEVKLDLNTLIENIYTTPFEKDEWFNTLVNNLIKRYSYNFKCQKSNLMDSPI